MNSAFDQQEHGGAAAWGLEALPELLDLSVNVNPYGPPPGLLEHLQEVRWWLYPDPHAAALHRAIAASRATHPEHIVLGNGANELLWAIARAFLKPHGVFTVLEPAYSEFTRAALQVGARAAPFGRAPEAYAHALQPDELLDFLRREQTEVLYLCNPNSPTGAYLEPAFIRELSRALPEILIVLDESFLSLSEQHARSQQLYPASVLRVVSLTKDFALAGLRLGYAFGAREHIARLRREIPTWSVNSLAQAAGLFCLEQPHFLAESRERLLGDRRALEAELAERGLRCLPSVTVYLMMQTPAGVDPIELARALLERHRVLIRGCGSYGWPGWWRIAARDAASRQRFFQALQSEAL